MHRVKRCSCVNPERSSVSLRCGLQNRIMMCISYKLCVRIWIYGQCGSATVCAIVGIVLVTKMTWSMTVNMTISF